MFPPKCRVSKKYTPREILTAKPVGYKKDFKISFGSYGQEINKTNRKNTTTPRTLGVIYLRALDTLQGGFEVINLLYKSDGTDRQIEKFGDIWESTRNTRMENYVTARAREN